MNPIIESYFSAGLSLLPVKADKRPLNDWLQYKTVRALPNDYSVWNLPVGCIGGKISGGLVCIDFDDKGSAFKEWGELIREQSPELIDKLVFQKTPSGGYHAVYRTKKEQRNEKLAMKDKSTVLIETRGEGGYFVIAPSEGYKIIRGDFTKIQEISDDEHEILITTSRRFNQVVADQPKQQAEVYAKTGLTPFDDYDLKHDPVELLCSHGWSIVSHKNDKTELCRPGKQRTVSATWNYIKDRFYVFSTSTTFSNEHLYKPSAVYTVLEHNGDFVAAAKDLYAKGYGERFKKEEKAPVVLDTVVTTKTVKASDFQNDIVAFYTKGFETGKRINITSVDNIIRFDHSQLNVITGIPTHGKSEILDFLLIQLAKLHKWKTVFFSPENYPLSIHFNKLAEKFHEKNLYKSDGATIAEAIEFIDEHFRFIDATEDELTLENILASCLECKKDFKADCLVIDPWNEIESSRPRELTESEFTGNCLRKLRKFARKNNICVFVVAHPTKLQKIKDKDIYPVPSLYDISGSSNWYNKADNGFVVYRDFVNNLTEFHVKKVKFRNYGNLGTAFFSYDKECGIFIEQSGQTVENERERNSWPE